MKTIKSLGSKINFDVLSKKYKVTFKELSISYI